MAKIYQEIEITTGAIQENLVSRAKVSQHNYLEEFFDEKLFYNKV
jgi:hypothetical protein